MLSFDGVAAVMFVLHTEKKESFDVHFLRLVGQDFKRTLPV